MVTRPVVLTVGARHAVPRAQYGCARAPTSLYFASLTTSLEKNPLILSEGGKDPFSKRCPWDTR